MEKYVRLFFIVSAVVITILSLIKGTGLVENSGCVDLRCRIVGTRLSHAGYSPYFYKWTTGDSSYFLDPNDQPGRKVNGNVVTPAVFKIFHVIAQLKYPLIKVIWVLLQYLFILSSFFLLTRNKKNNGNDNFFPFIIVWLCYIYSNIWFYNVERGQLYSFYLFILSLIYGFYQSSWKQGTFASGFVNGLAVCIRPLMIVFAMPFFFKKDIKWIKGCICGAIVGIGLFALPFIHEWKGYFSAMKEYSNETTMKHYSAGAKQEIPAIIEGSSNMQISKPFQCGGLSTVQYYLAAKGITVQSFTLAVVYFIIAIGLCLMFVRSKPQYQSMEKAFLFAFLLYILSELFIIGHRGGYNQIQWIFGVFLLCRMKAFPGLLLAGMLAAILLENIQLNIIPYQFEFAEIILICILFYQVLGNEYIKKRQLSKV
ncbi:MAG: glycosyltransferase 87 family protein [Bacteroidota bacterium]